MKNKILLIVLFFVSSAILGQTVDLIKLAEEIEQNNIALDYKKSIIRLHKIIADKNSGDIDKSIAYYQKYQLFKRLAIYSEALVNLDEAFAYGKMTDSKDLITIKYELETASTYCEKLEYKQALSRFNNLKVDAILLEGSDLGLYLFLKGIDALERTLVYRDAVDYFMKSIEIFKEVYPQYLPVVYKELLRAYAFLGQHNDVVDSYQKGIAYAEQFQWSSELIQLHRFMAIYYQQIGENKKSLSTSSLVLALATKYDTVNLSSSLNILEKQLLEEDAALNKNTGIQKALQAFLAIAFACIVVYLLLYRRNLVKHKQVLKENETLRVNYESLSVQDKHVIDIDNKELTTRQKEIVLLVQKGKTNKEIASELFVSENTVKYHLKIIYEVLKVKGRTDLLV
ncbi:helix-turn-helix transcriptional regulator [Myroides sp. M-43]|uniref:helix-turn-helix domain-containing protein n=1 Tax=Myroides oncorhynchi TaxID=2893756 RepID=UPI001E2D55DC|nr:helix-turn-helix transcriptional regulator [Myroides oncorhynchi]MCC9043292.1 helix-turn-helix transcriptional regulator [Myroides oncorhynchi]